ncbi:unnamed protein product [Amoebophrya sp. A25]|nr:unnamed protein product [Amoebophrya sp. A25]|eukprot:GSA25T00015406001.1
MSSSPCCFPLLLLAGAAVRLLWFSLLRPGALEDDPELVSPVSSHLRLQETAFLYDFFRSAEPTGAGGIDAGAMRRLYLPHQNANYLPPIAFVLLRPFVGGLAYWTLLLFVDLAIAFIIRDLAKARQRTEDPEEGSTSRSCSSKTYSNPDSIPSHLLSPSAVGLVYFFNPWVAASHNALSLGNVHVLALLLPIVLALRGRNFVASAAAFAIALYLIPFTSVILLCPLAALSAAAAAQSRRNKSRKQEPVWSGDDNKNENITKNRATLISSLSTRNEHVEAVARDRNLVTLETAGERLKVVAEKEWAMKSGEDKKNSSAAESTINEKTKDDIGDKNTTFIFSLPHVYAPLWSQASSFRPFLNENALFFRMLFLYTITTALVFVFLLHLSARLCGGSWAFLHSSFFALLRVEDLSPSLSVFWYMFQEVFLQFQNFFLLVFHAHVLVYVLPLHMLLSLDYRSSTFGPLANCVASFGLVALFRPYPTVVDFSALVALYCVFADYVFPVPHLRRLRTRVFILAKNDKTYVPLRFREDLTFFEVQELLVEQISRVSRSTTKTPKINEVAENVHEPREEEYSPSGEPIPAPSEVAVDDEDTKDKDKMNSIEVVGRTSDTSSSSKSNDTSIFSDHEDVHASSTTTGNHNTSTRGAKNKFMNPQTRLVLELAFALFGLTMYPVMSAVWLFRNTGNANFMFFMQLVYLIATSLSLLDFICMTHQAQRIVLPCF